MDFPRLRIGVTPSAILNSHPAFQVSLDRRISKTLNFSLESGFIFTSASNSKGFRLRPGLEVFTARSAWVSLVSGLHLNFRHSIGYVNDVTTAINGEFRYIDHNLKNRNTLLGLNVENKLMFKVSKRAYIDIGSGLGLGRQITSGSERLDFNGLQLDGPIRIARSFPNIIFYTHLNFSYDISQ